MIFQLGGLLVLFLVSVFLLSILYNTRLDKRETWDKEIEVLDSKIEMKQKLLNDLTSKIDSKTIDKSVNLNNMEIAVLDIYDNSNIQIPSDILEEVSRMQLDNEKEIFDFIENQRYYWKLENTKKPYKKGL